MTNWTFWTKEKATPPTGVALTLGLGGMPERPIPVGIR